VSSSTILSKFTSEFTEFTPLQLRRVCRPAEVEEVTGMSWDSFKRLYPELVVELGPKMRGVALGNVLKVAAGEV
jgi:hypothetical protein